MFISCKQQYKLLQLTVTVYTVLILSVLWASCSNHPGAAVALPNKLQHGDTLKIRSQNIFRIYASKITRANGSDSILLLLDAETSLLYKVDTANHIVAADTLPGTVTADLRHFTYHKGAYYVMYENLLKKIPADSFGKKPKEYTFNHADVNVNYTTISQFRIDSDNSFLIYGVPKGVDYTYAAGRARFFGSAIVNRAMIEEGSTLINTRSQPDITFPERYKKFYYDDTYPVFCSFGDSIIYTTRHFDSLALVSRGKKTFYKIPQQFSVVSEPAPESCVQSMTESSEYFAKHSTNIILLNFNRKILLFQALKADQYYDEESGMINDVISRKKRVLIFDIDKKQFEQTAYELPANCNPVKSIVFNDKLYIFFTDENRKEISVMPITL